MSLRGAAIVAPGTGRWVRPFLDVGRITAANATIALVLIALFVLSAGLVAGGPLAAKAAGGGLGAVLVGGLLAGARGTTRRTVIPGEWRFKGQPIVGRARVLLAAATIHAADAEERVAGLPSVDWTQFRPEVDAVLWDAASHAADVCRLNEQINRITSANHVVPDDLWRRREEHLAVVEGAAVEMLELVRVVGETVAAAAVEPPVSRKGRRGPRGRRSQPPSDLQPED